MKEIALTQGQVALVDDSDFLLLDQWKWFAVRKKKTFYACRQVRLYKGGPQKMLAMHRVITGADDDEDVDHKNHTGTDNRRKNLRKCPGPKNTQHYQKPDTNTSGFIGVSKLGGKWRAEFAVSGKNRYLGLFKTPEEAARARDSAVKSHRGEFAVLNFK